MRLIWQPPKINSMMAHHESGAEHSVFVVTGGYRSDGSVMPGRDFFQSAIDKTNFTITNGDIETGFNQINEELHINIKDAIASKQWEWDRTTYRRNGEVATSPRNIVDTGELLNSQSWGIQPSTENNPT